MLKFSHIFLCLSYLFLKNNFYLIKIFQNLKWLKQKMACVEKEKDNPFGPVCQCCNCLKGSDRSNYCFCTSQIPTKAKWHPKPNFRLFFKRGMPCLECKRINCPHYFLDSKSPCSKKSDCNIICPGQWMMSWKLAVQREREREATKRANNQRWDHAVLIKILTCTALNLNCEMHEWNLFWKLHK